MTILEFVRDLARFQQKKIMRNLPKTDHPAYPHARAEFSNWKVLEAEFSRWVEDEEKIAAVLENITAPDENQINELLIEISNIHKKNKVDKDSIRQVLISDASEKLKSMSVEELERLLSSMKELEG